MPTDTPPLKRAVLYLRCSTKEQDTRMQEMRLRDVAARSAWSIVDVYEDAGVSGAHGRDRRPQFDRMMVDATRRQFDVVLVWSIDRLSRSLRDLVLTIEDLNHIGIDLYVDQQGIDSTTPSGRAMWQMLGVFAEFERAIIRERILAGMARAKKFGTRSGRKIGKAPLDPAVIRKIEKDLANGETISGCAKKHRVGISTVRRVKWGIHPMSKRK